MQHRGAPVHLLRERGIRPAAVMQDERGLIGPLCGHRRDHCLNAHYWALAATRCPTSPITYCVDRYRKVGHALRDAVFHAALRYPLRLACQIIDENIFAQALWGGEEGAALVELRHLIDELHQAAPSLQHEGVDDDVLLRAAH